MDNKDNRNHNRDATDGENGKTADIMRIKTMLRQARHYQEVYNQVAGTLVADLLDRHHHKRSR